MTNENTKNVALPAEVAQIAENVSVEKRNEVQTVLNQIFNGVAKMRDQIDSITVADEKDVLSMKLSNTYRLAVRQERLAGEKTIDTKRDELKIKMLGDKTEDSLWLKAKQTMQILTKELEETARWKEDTAKRFETERKELKIQERINKVAKIDEEILRVEFENMSDETFNMFYSAIEKKRNDAIEAEREAEAERQRIEKETNLHHARKESILHLWQFLDKDVQALHFGQFTDKEWDKLVLAMNAKKVAYDKEQARIKADNERLQKEAIEIERLAKIEREKAQKKATEERAESERVLKIEREKQEKIKAENEKELQIEREKQRKLEADLKAKEEQERKDKAAKAKAELERIAAEKKAKAAPDKDKLTVFVNSLSLPEIELKSMEAATIENDIRNKFESFKKWAISQIETI